MINNNLFLLQDNLLNVWLTVLAGEDNLRPPSGLYHISWYPGANSCLLAKSTCLVSDIQPHETETTWWQNCENKEEKLQEPVEIEDPLAQLTVHKTFTLPKGSFKDLDKDPPTDKNRKKNVGQRCDGHTIHMYVSQMTPTLCTETANSLSSELNLLEQATFVWQVYYSPTSFYVFIYNMEFLH